MIAPNKKKMRNVALDQPSPHQAQADPEATANIRSATVQAISCRLPLARNRSRVDSENAIATRVAITATTRSVIRGRVYSRTSQPSGVQPDTWRSLSSSVRTVSVF